MADVPTVTIRVTDSAELLQMAQRKLARVVREFAEREAGPVRERLLQIADVFEVS